MTQDEIIEMAKQAGLLDMDFEAGDWEIHELTTFARLVADKATEEANARANASWTLMCKKMVAAEREELAAEAERNGNTILAMQIRARGQE